MFSIFAVPKGFDGEFDVIQRNAIHSWRLLPGVRGVLLLGDEPGVSTAARELGVGHHPAVEQDEYGTPLLSDALAVAMANSATDWLCYVNADIILMPEFGTVIEQAQRQFERALIVSRRWNLSLDRAIDFAGDWPAQLRRQVEKDGELFTPYGIDVFAFHRSVFRNVPHFAIGRSYWDNWLVRAARQAGEHVIDATAAAAVIHQNHHYAGFADMGAIRESQQGRRNYWMAGDSPFYLARTDDATHLWTPQGIQRASTPAVSVVITHHGPLADAYRCIRALTHQTYPRTYMEILLVVHDEDGPARAVELDFPFVAVHRGRGGPAAARNKGAACASGDLIAFVDSNCRPFPEWLERSVAKLEQMGRNGIVAANMIPHFDPSARTVTELYEAFAFHKQKRYGGECATCIGDGLLLSRDVWRRLGPFDLGAAEADCEDWEWSSRAKGLKVPLVHAAYAPVKRPVHRTVAGLRAEALRLVRGELGMAHKRGGADLRTLRSALRVHTQRLRGDLANIWSTPGLRLSERCAMSALGCAVCWWAVLESRRTLRTMKNSGPPAPGDRRV